MASLLTTGLAAVGTRALSEFSRHALEEVCRRRRAPERLGQILRGYEQAALAAETIQVMATAVCVGSAALWGLSAPAATALWPLVGSIAGGLVVLLFVEIWLPWALARLWAEPFLYFTWPLWRLLSVLLAPVALGAWFVDTLLHRLAGRVHEEPDEESFEDEIRTVVTEGHREGLLEEDAREMIEGVIQLGDIDVSQVMTPRTDMVSLSKSLSWEDALDFVTTVGHTRIPVYDRTRDDIIGILYVKDLLPELAKGPQEPVRPWTDLLREPYFVPETKPVDVLLQEFQLTRNHMAVVLDEYGGVSGLITLEDVLEEIVGEIVDESDRDLVDGIRQLEPGAAEVLGKVHVDEINERLNLHLPEEDDFDTIGGMVFSRLGHVPVPGEEILVGPVRITVLEATRRRIERVRIELVDHRQAETA